MTQRHNEALDGLRWFAFLGVFLFHAYEKEFHLGQYGVQIFFTLSGFLIGGILLSLRDRTDTPLKERLRIFYIRRSLRIFPLYYLVLLMIVALSMLHILNGRLHVLPFHALYLTNFYLFFTGEQLDSQTHFWSLCVEEHFYLIAPLILLTASFRTLSVGVLVLFLCTMIGRLVNFFILQNPMFHYLSFMEFDIIVIGVIASIILHRGSFLGFSEERFLKVGAVSTVGVVAIMLLSIYPSYLSRFAETVLFEPLPALATAGLLMRLWKGKAVGIGRFLAWPPFAFLGKISYGLYIYHMFSYIIARHSVGSRRVLLLGVCLLATIAVASLSWFLFENPINERKRFFPYPRAKSKETADA